MRKIVTLLLFTCMIVSLAACGDATSKKAKIEKEADKENNQVITVAPIEDDNGSDSAGLVIDGSKLGVLQKLSSKAKLEFKGIIITSGSGQHKYPIIEEIVESGYKKSGIYSEYELNEWFEIYVKTAVENFPMNVYVVKNDEGADYASMTTAAIKSLCVNDDLPLLLDVTPDEDNNGCIGQMYLNSDTAEAGLYNIFFTSGKDVFYMVQIEIVPEGSV